MNLVRVHSVFSSTHKLNEIEIINHVQNLRSQAKRLGLTGVLTYRAGLFALYAEGRNSSIQKFLEHLSDTFSIKFNDILSILSRKYTGIVMSYVGTDVPIVNEPLLDWGIENPLVIFPHELMGKMLEINRESSG